MQTLRTFTFLAAACCATSAYAATLIDLTQEDFKRAKSENYQLKVLNETQDKSGNTHIRYEQTYQNIPVYGYQVIEHHYQRTVKAQGMQLKPYTGVYVQHLEKDLPQARALSSDPAKSLEKLKMDYASQQGVAVDQLVFENEFARTVIFIDANNEGILANEVSFYVDTPEGGMPSRPHYLIDAQTSTILKQWDGLAHEDIGVGPGGNERIGLYSYGKDYPAFDITKKKARCTFSGAEGKTINMKNKMAGPSKPYSYNCRSDMTQDSDAANGAASPLNDAQAFMDILTAFYISRYDKAPLPFALVMRAHYGKNYSNAFWNGSSMTYGDGNESTYPYVILDVAAHEISHGVTEHNSNLAYDGQSGGMNESFSDMASRAIEQYAYGKHDWYLGGGIFKDPSRLALRYLDLPSRDGKSIDSAADYTDGLDVHYSSGVYNRAFYLLATTPGWDTLSAFDVMYTANVGYWQPTTNFATGAWGVVQAAASLEANVDDVINVFSQVGIQCDKLAGICV